MADTKTIIETLFQAMVRHRPGLAGLLAMVEDGTLDVRELADQVVKGFPYPIGVELRRLFSSEHNHADRGRLDQLFKTIERTLQFTAFVMLSQLLEEGRDRTLSRSGPLFERLVKPAGLTMGDFASFINAAGDAFREEGIVPFMPEMAEVLGKGFYSKLHFWTPERNEIGHYLINLDAGEIERRCFEYGERLADLLSSLAFLIKYPLVSMVEIRVEKAKSSPACFSHNMRPLSSSSANLPDEALCETFTDSHAVLLIKSMRDPPSGFLNLSPLVIDTQAEELTSREQVENIKKDIFLFSRRDRDGRLRYLGTTVTEQCDLRSLSCYERLQTEFGEYLRAAGLDEPASVAPAAGSAHDRGEQSALQVPRPLYQGRSRHLLRPGSGDRRALFPAARLRPAADLQALVQRLIAARILSDRDLHGSYELRHDSLARKVWQRMTAPEKELLEIRQTIEIRYRDYRRRGLLLDADTLSYLAAYEDGLLLPAAQPAFVSPSREAAERKRRRRLPWPSRP